MHGLARMSAGLGYGSFVYLFVTLFNKQQVVLTHETVWSIFLISAGAGALSYLFDIERISFLLALAAHFVLTNLVVLLTLLFNDWIEDATWSSYFGSLLLFYTISWIVFIIRNKMIARELNQGLKHNANNSR
ncbi:DUF3021 family protein [Paenibacillus sp. BK033]|uniref:DUF3021 family protein n=1 Tax=Paenibacillus sp. BK033 TaxID=2512133 RepID=UPI00104A2FFD|nr:DUF3021 family protein [Paenibacillus sp. BK033]TCM96412.1 DUF3021 family protein [Paenibacillus sp. BK033]